MPDFVEKWKFLGILSEQGIESLHHRLNLAEVRFTVIKNEKQRWERILAEQAMKNALYDRKVSSDVTDHII